MHLKSFFLIILFYFLEIRKHLEAHLSSFMQSLEASILKRHETTNKEIEPKLQELTEVLQRIGMDTITNPVYFSITLYIVCVYV